MAGPWEKYSAPSDTGPWERYGTQPTEPSFPYDKPGVEYGSILPLARDAASGKLSLAAPEAIRAPLRGAIEWGRELTGQVAPTPENLKPTPDQEAALMALGGLRAAPPSTSGASVAARIVPKQVTDTRDAGYVLPPAMTGKPGPITSMLSGWGGKIKLQQSASVKNQEITNSLAARSLGLPEDTVLSPKVIEDVRSRAGKAYDDVEKSVPTILPNDRYLATVAGLGKANSQAAQYFPNIMKNPGIDALREELGGVHYFSPKAGLEVVKELRFNANSNLRKPGDPMAHQLGLAQREAADAIDQLMDDNISATDPGIIARYRDARQQIAKSYDIEGAMNPATGDVNALGIGRLAVKGRPLTGDLATVANAANAFPRALQNVSRFGGDEAHSAVDFFGSALAIGQGDPALAATILARPAVRSLLLSKTQQNRLAYPSSKDKILPFPMPAASVLSVLGQTPSQEQQ